MELVIFVLVLGCVCFWLLWKDECEKNASLQEEMKFAKEAVTSLYTKPIYAAITDRQIQQLAQLLSEYLQPTKWPN